MTFLKYVAATFGPVLICWIAVNIAFISGKAGNWWPVLLAGLLCGSAIFWASAVAEAEAKSKWATLLYNTMANGVDTTITVEHFHADAKREDR